MTQWLKSRTAAFLVGCFLIGALGSGAWYYFANPGGPIQEFQYERDSQEILNIFDQDWYWLVANSRDEYSPEFMLKYKASHQDPAFAGRMHLHVLREHDQFVGFVAYYKKTNAALWFLNFVGVKPEFRGKGYAEILVRYALNDMKNNGAHTVELITRPSNTNARKLYTRLGFAETFNDGEYVGYRYTF